MTITSLLARPLAVATLFLMIAPASLAGEDPPPAYDFGTLWPLGITGVDVAYNSGAKPTAVCVGFDEDEDPSITALCVDLKSSTLRVRGEITTAQGVTGPIPYGEDDAFLYFGSFKDTLPAGTVPNTGVQCVGIFQEGGATAGVTSDDDLLLYTNCPSALNSFTMPEPPEPEP